VLAQDNAIESISANQQGGNVVLNIAMKEAPKKLPIGFSITNPGAHRARLRRHRQRHRQEQPGHQPGRRARRERGAGRRTHPPGGEPAAPLNYATAIDGKSVIVTVEGSGGVAQAVNAAGIAGAPGQPAPAATQLLRDLDFRRGANGEGRVVVDLPNNQVAVDVRQVGNKIQVDFLRTGLPPKRCAGAST
jgi:type IV pilus assembly protein PilQ